MKKVISILLIVMICAMLFACDGARYNSQVSWAGYTDSDEVYSKCLNSHKMSLYDDVCHLPIFKIESVDALNAFKEDFKDCFDFASGRDEMLSFNEISSAYDDDYFEANALLIIYVSTNSSSYRYGLESVNIHDNTCEVVIKTTKSPKDVDDDMAGWLVAVEIKRTELADCTSFDAVLQGK